MTAAIAPVWDGNETWLVLGGGGLFAVFPLAYATILPALYMPLILMLLALVFRGVAFEFRFKAHTERGRNLWDIAFCGGSFVATFTQGIALGALVQGIKVADRAYAGGWWDWLSPFSLLTGVALIAGYALLGAGWLIWKTGGALQSRVRLLASYFAIATLVFIGLISAIMPFLQESFYARWLTLPNMLYAAPVPILVVLLAWRLLTALRQDRHATPFLCALGLFFLSYVGLGISLYPNIVPPDIDIWEAATVRSSQIFLLVGAGVLIPIILGYTGYVYWLFRGKVTRDSHYH